MHMSDALITPIVGGTMLASSGGVVGYSIKKIKVDVYEKRLPLMAVMGAFLFAAQMINFAIPGTGSSGHIGGGMLLAIILGPFASFLTMACVLLIQALFFADGGLLALGCNLINLGFFTGFIAYPFIYKPLTRTKVNPSKIMIASILAAVVGLQLGSLAVVVETVLSGRTELSFASFLMFMQPIHLAIGIVEGIITGVVVNYIYSQNTNMIYAHSDMESNNQRSGKNRFRVIVTLVMVTVIVGSGISLFASSSPDGLEWAIEKTTTEEITSDSTLASWLQSIQDRVAFMPDYQLKGNNNEYLGTSLSGFVGSGLTLLAALSILFLIRKKRAKVNE